MRIVIQRVKHAQVTVQGTVIGKIDQGLCILLGIHAADDTAQADILADKCVNLRIFSDESGKMNHSLTDIHGAALIVSQFTLYGDCTKGRRPSFTTAAAPEKGKQLYEYFVDKMRSLCTQVQTGMFGAMMDVELVNDGPVTFILDANA